MKTIRIVLLIALFPVLVSAQQLRITQIDTYRPLLDGKLAVYVAVDEDDDGIISAGTGDNQESLDVAGFTASQSGHDLDIQSVEFRSNQDETVSYVLLLDNSGSMYDSTIGNQLRWDAAVDAVYAFIDRLRSEGKNDHVGVSTFNTYVEQLRPVQDDLLSISRSLDSVERPDRASAYTELYTALYKSALEVSASNGRRVVIVLSDGRNLTYESGEGVAHPLAETDADFSNSDADSVISAYRQAGISLFAISLAESPDPLLVDVVSRTGGVLYSGDAIQDLSGVYRDIGRRVEAEYRIIIRAPFTGEDVSELQISYDGVSDSRSYIVPNLFGAPGDIPTVLLIAMLLLGPVLGGILYAIPFESAAKGAELRSINSAGTIMLERDVTVIAADGDFTGYDGAADATVGVRIARTRKDDREIFTVFPAPDVYLNNRRLTEKTILKAGDVITQDGSMTVFDRKS